MNKFNPNLHHRKSIRLKGYDYSQKGLYFITLCCQNREHLFGCIENEEMHLNEIGKIAEQEWLNTPKVRDNTTLHEHIIMPNHLHGIIEITRKKEESKGSEGSKGSKGEDGKGKDSKGGKGELQFAPTVPTAPTIAQSFKSPSQTIGSIIRGYKISVIKRIKDYMEDSKSEDGKGEDSKGEDGKGGKGELQFAPTIAPTIAALNYKIWQRNYYEHIIKDEKAYQNIANYIINNPSKWNEDTFNK